MNAKERRIKEAQYFALRHPIVDGVDLEAGHYHGDSNVSIAVAIVKDPAQFDGMPVWMASMERKNLYGKVVPVMLWTYQAQVAGEQELLAYLSGVGTPARERLFHTNATMVLVRAITSDEWNALDATTFHDADPLRYDGGPVEIIRSNWQAREAAYPCHNPGRKGDNLLWKPVDCGLCPPCLDRAGLESERQRVCREKEEAEERLAQYNAFVATPEGKDWLARRDIEARERGDY